MTISRRATIARDSSGIPIRGGMGLPLIERTKPLGRADVWVPLMDLRGSDRVFQGLSIVNPSAKVVYLGYSQSYKENEVVEFLEVTSGELLTFDKLMFGPLTTDVSSGLKANYLWGKLDTAEGDFATGKIELGSNPLDATQIKINGITYEFSADHSKSFDSDRLVDIGADASATAANLKTKLEACEPTFRYVLAGAELTLESNYPGLYGNGLALTDVDSGATITPMAGATDTGVKASIHIW